MGLFKSKTEKEREKLLKEEAKMNKGIQEAEELSQIARRRDALDKKKDKIDEINFKDKVRKAGTNLNILEKKFTTRLQSDINSVKNKQEQNLPFDRERLRLKNSYYTLITIRRAKERLVQVQNEREWHLAMRDLSKTLKILNDISGGSKLLQKILFQHRYSNMLDKEAAGDKMLNGYYGFSIDNAVKDAEIEHIMQGDLIDMLVTDELYKRLLSNPSPIEIRECINKNVGVELQPDMVEKMAEKDEDYMKFEQSTVTMTDEEAEAILEGFGKI